MTKPLCVHPPLYADRGDSGMLILRDGSTATVRPSLPEDEPGLRAFFSRLGAQALRQRFLAVSKTVPDDIISSLCDSSHPAKALTLMVTRNDGSQEEIVATASYSSRGRHAAEVAFAVSDELQGKGIASQLLERLCVIAIRNGFLRFWAITSMDNYRMIDVFRHSGFDLHEHVEQGYVEVDFSVRPTDDSAATSALRDRLYTAASIRPFIKPNAIVVVGASRDPSSIGYRLVDEVVRAGFTGPVYAVNPHAAAIAQVTAYPSVKELPGPVDLAVIAVPRDHVLEVVDDCAERGIRALVVISAGFGECGEEGAALQQKLLEKVRGYGIRMIGPNCMGIVNTDPRAPLNASFSPVFPRTGGIAISSQSGAVGLALLALASDRGLGISSFVSVGNKADVSSNDLIQYWENDPATKVILLYLESFGNPRRFARIARRVCRTKPIIAVKAGRTPAGGRAAGSHTAALTSSDTATDALFRQTGVIRAETLDELYAIGAVLESQPLTPGRRVGIVTNAGGPGILCADACEAGRLTVPELDEETRSALRTILPPTAGVANPVDMVASASPSSYSRVIETVLGSPEIDAAIVIYIPLDRDGSDAMIEAIRRGVEQAREKGVRGKPVVVCILSPAPAKALKAGGETLPVFASPEMAARVLSKCAEYASWRAQDEGFVPELDNLDITAARKRVKDLLMSASESWLSPEDIGIVLSAFGIRQPPSEVAMSRQKAIEIADRIGYPVVLKLASTEILHKSDVGGVYLNLQNASQVALAFKKLEIRLASEGRLHAMDGALIQPMIREGIELMVGVTTDSLFGPLVAFGLGGVQVEVLGDVRFRITPLTDTDAHCMIQEIRGYRLLTGYRGRPKGDCNALEDLLLRVSRMVEEIPEIVELDFNPVVALPPGEGCLVLDARIRVQRNS